MSELSSSFSAAGVETFLRKIHEIAIQSHQDFEDEISQLLELGKHEFGFEVGLITTSHGAELVVDYATKSDRLPIGIKVETCDSFCGEVLKRGIPLLIKDVEHSEYANHPGHIKLGIASYLGHPLQASHGAKGTLCFLSWEPRNFDRDPGVPEQLVLLAQRIEAVMEKLEVTKALRASEELFRSTFEYANVGISRVNLDGKWIEVNERLCQILGYEKDELLKCSFQEITFEEDLKTNLNLMQSALNGEIDHYQLQKRYLKKDGIPVWTHLSAKLVRTEDGEPQYFVSVIEDIDAQKKAEAEKIAFEESVQEAQKLESLGVLAGGIAHDFNNLLTSIIGNANLLENTLGEDSPLYSQVATIEKAAEHAADLTRQLLAYAGKGNVIVQNVGLVALVNEMQKLLTTAISKRVELSWEEPARECWVRADVTQIRQVIMNLITNASEAIGSAAGTVSLSIDTLEIDEEQAASKRWTISPLAGTYIRLRVEDNGSGMDEETARRIFEPFYTRKFQGRGLGLSAVLGIIRSHGGALRFRSRPGEGTVFEVFFKQLESKVSNVGSEKDKPTTQQKGLALVVDDEPSVREVAGTMMNLIGYTVVTAECGDEVLKQLASIDRPNLVLLDVSMPGISIEETLTGIREMHPQTPVLLMSGYNEEHVQQLLKDYKPILFLQKPFTFSSLNTQISNLLDGSEKKNEIANAEREN